MGTEQDKKLHGRFQNWTDEDLRIALEDARLFGTEKRLIALELVRRKEKEEVLSGIRELKAERDRYKAALERIAREPLPEADAIPIEMFYELQLIAKNELKGADSQ